MTAPAPLAAPLAARAVALPALLGLVLALAAAPVRASDAGSSAPEDPDVALCLKAWQAEQDAHGGGELTLFAHEVRERAKYKIVELTLGSGEGRLIDGKCRIQDGKVTHTYE